MTEADKSHERVASAMRISTDAVRNAAEDYDERPLPKLILADRIEQIIAETRRKYDSVTPDDLKRVQGEVAGLNKALAAITQQTL